MILKCLALSLTQYVLVFSKECFKYKTLKTHKYNHKVEKVEFYRIQQKTILLFSFTLPLTLYLDSYFIVLFDKILVYL